MPTKIMRLFFSLALATGFIYNTQAAETSANASNFLMWQLPNTVNFPVYVYKSGAQTDYIYGQTQQAFLGSYPSGSDGTYTLFYQSANSGPSASFSSASSSSLANNWVSCVLALKKGAVDSSATTCPGVVINNPVTGSNVYTVAFGASPWPGNAVPVSPINQDYGNRKITFKNNSAYANIQIGMVCTQSVNPNNPNCQNTQNLLQISNGNSADFFVDSKTQEGQNFPAGLNSYAFTVTAYQTTSSAAWVNTGGYQAGGTPYATKIELTSAPVSTQQGAQYPQGATNFDVSAVDGYNISVKAYPAKPTYCTYTVPPENSNILGAGLYSNGSSLGELTISENLCLQSSQLPPTASNSQQSSSTGAWNLAVKNSNNFQGCMSPCTYAKVYGNSAQDMFCCAGSFNTPATCDQPSGQLGANNSTYVTNLNPPVSSRVYRFAYDDAIGDFACPAETDFIIEFR
ncbi:hypothetical protein D0C16_17265 [Cellvibrio sp. KY-GH-1]|uniref:thaumatin family protein n=1 Tax=Cellvibrio sp. KY-GH-1 TaxID=2303332 RepID=UPI0012465DE3|nr:thaumatin family protein [Cellvibrio sp. KY-GH-1]QEY17580.1 hypothetical protein D0C16_17265 [Cellvibrio sp. KY-GH-1]